MVMKQLCKHITLFAMTCVLMVSMLFSVPLDAEAKSVKPSVSGKSTITKGKKAQFTVKYKGKRISAKSCKWYSTKKSVATVSKSGKVTGKKAGTTYIYVKYKGKKSAKKKVVVKKTAVRPSISGSSAIVKGKNAQFTVKYRGKRVSAKSCKWYSTKKSVAKVGKTGRVYAKKAGTTYIYAKYKGKTSAKKKVTVKNPACIKESDHKWVKQFSMGTNTYITVVKRAKVYNICNSCGLLMDPNSDETETHFNSYSTYHYGPEIYRQDVDTVTTYNCSNCGKTKRVEKTELGEERLAVFDIETWAGKKFDPEACAYVSCPRCRTEWSTVAWEKNNGVCPWCKKEYPDWKDHIEHAWDQGLVYRNWDKNGREMRYNPDKKKWEYTAS